MGQLPRVKRSRTHGAGVTAKRLRCPLPPRGRGGSGGRYVRLLNAEKVDHKEPCFVSCTLKAWLYDMGQIHLLIGSNGSIYLYYTDMRVIQLCCTAGDGTIEALDLKGRQQPRTRIVSVWCRSASAWMHTLAQQCCLHTQHVPPALTGKRGLERSFALLQARQLDRLSSIIAAVAASPGGRPVERILLDSRAAVEAAAASAAVQRITTRGREYRRSLVARFQTHVHIVRKIYRHKLFIAIYCFASLYFNCLCFFYSFQPEI